eukprot:Awhi_evm1s7243
MMESMHFSKGMNFGEHVNMDSNALGRSPLHCGSSASFDFNDMYKYINNNNNNSNNNIDNNNDHNIDNSNNSNKESDSDNNNDNMHSSKIFDSNRNSSSRSAEGDRLNGNNRGRNAAVKKSRMSMLQGETKKNLHTNSFNLFDSLKCHRSYVFDEKRYNDVFDYETFLNERENDALDAHGSDDEICKSSSSYLEVENSLKRSSSYDKVSQVIYKNRCRSSKDCTSSENRDAFADSNLSLHSPSQGVYPLRKRTISCFNFGKSPNRPPKNVSFSDSFPGLNLSIVKMYNPQDPATDCGKQIIKLFNSNSEEEILTKNEKQISEKFPKLKQKSKVAVSDRFLLTRINNLNPDSNSDSKNIDTDCSNNNSNYCKKSSYTGKYKETGRSDATSLKSPKKRRQLTFNDRHLVSSNFKRNMASPVIVLRRLTFNPVTSHIIYFVSVKNLSFQKKVFIRYSLNGWKTYEDIPAAYLSKDDLSEEDRDIFSCSLYIPDKVVDIPIDFAISYQYREESGVVTNWENCNGKNFTCSLKHVP